jgi:perosamine synthetase
MTDMQAAIGIVQHSKRHRFLARRKEIRRLYEENWNGNSIKGYWFANTQEGATNWVLPILTNNREDLRQHLAENGIDHRTYFNPFHKQQFLAKYSRGWDNDINYHTAEYLGKVGLYLPIYPTLTNDEVLYICEKVNKFYA